MTRWLAACALSLALAAAAPARATVDAYLPYYVPYQHLQTDDLCLMKQVMLAEIGIPPASQMLASFAPTQIAMQSIDGLTYGNHNLLATEPAIEVAYAGDSFDPVLEYEMVIDLTELSAANGTTRAGRRATILSAKLAIITMAANLGAISNNTYKLKVTFIGLPAQSDLAGVRRVYATTLWPYTHTSPVLSGYRHEVLNRSGSCPKNL